MTRHQWGASTYSYNKEVCVVCGVERFRGYYHQLSRPNRFGVSRKWRAPGPIRNGTPLCPGKQE